MSKRKLTYKDFKKYFSNHLQNEDKHAFEKEMMQDAFEEEAFDGLSQLSQFELGNDIAELKSNIYSRTQKRRRLTPAWFKYAASVLILVGVGLSLVYINSNFWQNSELKEQISQEMEIADSVLLDAAQESEKLADIKKDSVVESPENMIADNRKLKEQDVSEDLVLEIVEDHIEIEVADEIADKEVDEIEEDQQYALVDYEVEETVIDENGYVAAAEEPTEIVAAEQALQGIASGVSVEGNAKPSRKAKAKRLATINKTKTIKGKVLGLEDGLTIPGVSIVLKGSPTIGTTTNIDGEFSITIPEDDEELRTLIASFVGMETAEISLEDDSSLMVYMENSAMGLDEVIVSGIASGLEKDEVKIRVDAYPSETVTRLKYKRQIEEDLDYSKFTDFPGKHKIKVSFTVYSDGSLSGFSFKNSPDQVFSSEILRLIKEIGNWIPATLNDNNISSQVKLTLKIIVE
jgi:CarboxypepD_reg-like domain